MRTYELGDINDGSGLGLALCGVQSDLFIDERPNFVAVDHWGPLPVSLQVEYSNTALSEESRVTVVK